MPGTEHSAGQPYTVLARRFRPQTFDEVVGQEQIGQALRNAIQSSRVAHAYLFTGARGVGKTSTARIFAKALNCPNVRDAVPCNRCEICQAIGAGSDVDVLEIDGASNRGIDDIRTLRSNVNVRSMRSACKVYIIDEVHMLTKEAFNALLKTLEEPPPNVKFVFCTTEPNKVPDTILSRCQRFDFGTIAPDSIARRLTEIAVQEGIEVHPDAVDLVARRAAGSMRDSQSLFDQLLAFGGETVTAVDVHRLLGTAPDSRLVELFQGVIVQDRSGVLERLNGSLDEGVQIGSLADQLLNYLRDLLILSAGTTTVPLLSVAEGSRGDVAKQAEAWGLRNISAAMQVMTECRARMQRATHARALVELALVRMTLLADLDAIAAVVDGLASGAAPPARPPAAGTAPGAPLRPLTAASDVSKKKAPGLPDEHSPRDRLVDDRSASKSAANSGATPEPVHSAAMQEKPAQVFTFENLEQAWPWLLAQLPDPVAGHLRNCTKHAIFGPNTLEASFGASYFLSKAYCERPEVVSRLEAAATATFGRPMCVRFRMDSAAHRESAATRSPAASYERRPTSATANDAFVQSVLATFGGSVVEVRELPAAGPAAQDPADA
ncbi:MAG: DNA polymerase III subunit gamma/tau [Planctomyces sp.]|nr:DNA polymerase III subunit gamma/tau [Planctomyces sp.]